MEISLRQFFGGNGLLISIILKTDKMKIWLYQFENMNESDGTSRGNRKKDGEEKRKQKNRSSITNA
jgi:hypothetical protein